MVQKLGVLPLNWLYSFEIFSGCIVGVEPARSSVRPVAMMRRGCLATALESNEVTVSILLNY